MKKQKRFQTESEMCQSFIHWIERRGWIAYPETCEWDILLVRKSDDYQLGIQAKLQFNAKLLTQVLPLHGFQTGPDYRGILVPEISHEALGVCSYLGIDCFASDRIDLYAGDVILNYLHDWNPEKRHELPEYIPDTKAGSKSPIQLTKWKIAVLKVCAHLELNGEITPSIIQKLGCSPARWLIPELGWLKKIEGKRGFYSKGENLKFPDQHPEVYRQILEQLRG